MGWISLPSSTTVGMNPHIVDVTIVPVDVYSVIVSIVKTSARSDATTHSSMVTVTGVVVSMAVVVSVMVVSRTMMIRLVAMEAAIVVVVARIHDNER